MFEETTISNDIIFDSQGFDDALFPDFLFNPLFNEDFIEDYNKTHTLLSDDDDDDDEKERLEYLSKAARKIRKKRKNYEKYLQDVDIYNEYMEALARKYGGWSILKNCINEDLVNELIPPKPELKADRYTKTLLKAGLVPLTKVSEPDFSDFWEIYDLMYGNPEELTQEEIDHKVRKKEKEELKRAFDSYARDERRTGLFKDMKYNPGFDFIVEYYNQAAKGYYNTTRDDKYSMGFVERVKEERLNACLPDVYREKEPTELYAISGARLVSKKQSEQMEIIKALYEQGFNIDNNSMNKSTVKMVRKELGIKKPMTDKELKKWNKRQKRREREIKSRDSELSKLLTGNKWTFEDNDDMLSFTLKDLKR